MRAELAERVARSPVEVAQAVSAHYGLGLEPISYIQALAVIGRLRLAGLDGGGAREELVELAKELPPAKDSSGPAAAGHLVFAELGLSDRVIAAAQSALKNPGDNEMSDSIFMICPLLATAGRLGGGEQLFQACVDHLEKMQRLCLRDDGLYRHSPLDEAAWGRGNGFPAMGLAWALTELPESFAGRGKVLEDFRAHLAALTEHQDASGMWHQVIDHPESYREFTSTCMITFAILRGLREGWLDKVEYGEVADRGWEAVKRRISLDGNSFTDACDGTSKQQSLKDYFRRTAILGPDARSGAMALMVATERAWWERGGGEPDAPARRTWMTSTRPARRPPAPSEQAVSARLHRTDLAAAVGEALELHSHRPGLGQPQVGERCPLGHVDVLAGLEPAPAGAADDDRQVVVLVGRPVTEAGAVGEQGVVEQRWSRPAPRWRPFSLTDTHIAPCGSGRP